MSFILIGNYGDHNLGDEALLQYFLTEFRATDWRIVSARPLSPVELPRLPCGFRSFFSAWWKTIFAIVGSRGIVYGGGTLFTDIESVSACFMWASYAVIAHWFRVPIFLAFQGVGPFRTKRGAWVSRWVYRHATLISVRDEASFQRVQSWRLSVTPMRTFDPAFSFFSTHSRDEGHRRALVLIPRANSDEKFFHAVSAHLQSEHWDVVRILLMQSTTEEHLVARRLQKIVQKAEIIELKTVDELLTEVSRAAFVVTQRYHGALAALALGVPMNAVPLADGDKLAMLAQTRTGTDHAEYLTAIRSAAAALSTAMLHPKTSV